MTLKKRLDLLENYILLILNSYLKKSTKDVENKTNKTLLDIKKLLIWTMKLGRESNGILSTGMNKLNLQKMILMKEEFGSDQMYLSKKRNDLRKRKDPSNLFCKDLSWCVNYTYILYHIKIL